VRGAARAAVASGVILLSGCGYGLAGRANPNALPAHIRIISIPQFQNQSSTPEVDRRFQTIPDETGGDAILRGVITRVHSESIAFDSANQVTRLAIVVTANFEFVDVKDKKKIWERMGWQGREEYDISPGAIVADPSALFRQDANALNRLARSLARSLVTSILDTF
jgi:hypothetical protein